MDNLFLFQFSARTACDERAGAGPGGGPPGLSGGPAVDRLSQYQCTAHTVLEQSVIEDTTGKGAKRVFFNPPLPPPNLLTGAGASKSSRHKEPCPRDASEGAGNCGRA